MDKLVCDRYAEALFELAKENNKCQGIEEEVHTFKQVMEENSDFVKLLSHPGIKSEKKLELIKSVFTEIDSDLENFISLVLSKGRGDMLTGIFDCYIQLSRQERNIVTAEIVSAVALSEQQLQRLVAVLEKKLGKTVEPKVSVDSTLLGGLKITVCGRMINSTIKSKFDELKNLLEGSKTSNERRNAV